MSKAIVMGCCGHITAISSKSVKLFRPIPARMREILSEIAVKKIALAFILIAAGTMNVMAADIAVKALPAVIPTYSWTGLYVGLNAGYGRQDTNVGFAGNDPFSAGIIAGTLFLNGTPLLPNSFRAEGWSVGGQVGYNWQIARSWLTGVEADFSGASIKGNGSSTFSIGGGVFPTVTDTREIDWYGTLRVRAGWLASEALLLYGTGGLAYGHLKDHADLNANSPFIFARGGFGFSFACNPAIIQCFVGDSDRVSIGWTAGAGGEYVLSQSASLKLEYLYVNLGSNSVNVVTQRTAISTDPRASFTASFSQADFHTIRIGLNYRFGGPVVAKSY